MNTRIRNNPMQLDPIVTSLQKNKDNTYINELVYFLFVLELSGIPLTLKINIEISYHMQSYWLKFNKKHKFINNE